MYGSRGPAVATLQAKMNITVDGIFGKQTLGAVKTYQRAHGMTVNGIVGRTMWHALFG
jgi:peptidoglycan hydrolase-like protein with peptidoglycan-binding domain